MRWAWAVLVVMGCSDAQTGSWEVVQGPGNTGAAGTCAWAKHTTIGASIYEVECDPALHCSDTASQHASSSLDLTASDLAMRGVDIPLVAGPLAKGDVAAVDRYATSGNVTLTATGDPLSGSLTAINSVATMSIEFSVPYCD